MKYSILQRNKIINKINSFTSVKKFNINRLELYLNKHILVPHPDTFKLIQIAVNVLKKNSWIKTIADVGTGSGVIAVSLAKKFPSRTIFASDISKETLRVAKKNLVLNKVKNIHLLQNTDNLWLSEYKNKKIDFIISNAPFVGENEFNHRNFLLNYPEAKLEPKSAILVRGDEHGLSPYLKIIKNSGETNAKLYLFQCNSKNIKFLTEKIQNLVKCKINVIKDVKGLDRFLLISRT